MKEQVIIFDYDGTMVDSLDHLIDLYNRVGPQYRCRPVNKSDVPRLRSMKPQQIMKELKISFWKLPILLMKFRSEFSKITANIQFQPGMKEAIQALNQSGYTLAIVTTNSAANVAKYLEQHDMKDMFVGAYSSKRSYQKDGVLAQVLQQHQWAPEQVIYVGDEVRDIEASKRIGIRSIAVGWGYSSRDALLEQEPDHYVESAEQLLKALRIYEIVI